MAPLTSRSVASMLKNTIQAAKPKPLSLPRGQNHYPKSHGLHWDVITVFIGLAVLVSIGIIVWFLIRCTERVGAHRRRRAQLKRRHAELKKRKLEAIRMQELAKAMAEAREKARERAWSGNISDFPALVELDMMP